MFVGMTRSFKRNYTVHLKHRGSLLKTVKSSNYMNVRLQLQNNIFNEIYPNILYEMIYIIFILLLHTYFITRNIYIDEIFVKIPFSNCH